MIDEFSVQQMQMALVLAQRQRGFCSPNPSVGAVITREKQVLATGFHLGCGHPHAEIEALKLLREPCEIELHTDSQYVQKGITQWLPQWKKKHWKKSDNKPVKNADLWMQLDTEAARHKVHWYWVKGHNGHPENELVDFLANQAIDDYK